MKRRQKREEVTYSKKVENKSTQTEALTLGIIVKEAIFQ